MIIVAQAHGLLVAHPDLKIATAVVTIIRIFPSFEKVFQCMKIEIYACLAA